jgi:predicted transcriptional regulator
MPDPPLGDELRERREARGLSQGEVAQHVGVSNPAVVAWERNHNAATDKHAAALVELFGESDRSESLAERRASDTG